MLREEGPLNSSQLALGLAGGFTLYPHWVLFDRRAEPYSFREESSTKLIDIVARACNESHYFLSPHVALHQNINIGFQVSVYPRRNQTYSLLHGGFRTTLLAFVVAMAKLRDDHIPTNS